MFDLLIRVVDGIHLRPRRLFLLCLINFWLLHAITPMTLDLVLLTELAVHLLEVEPLLGVAHLLQQPVLNVHRLVGDLHRLRELMQVSLGELLQASQVTSLLISLLISQLISLWLHSHLQLLIRHLDLITVRICRRPLQPREVDLLLVESQAELVDLVHVVGQHLALPQEQLVAQQALVQGFGRHPVVKVVS